MLLGHCCHCDGTPSASGCAWIDWRWCTLTDVAVADPSGWDSQGEWLKSDGGDIYQWRPFVAPEFGSLVELPGVEYQPVQFADQQEFNGANSWWLQGWPGLPGGPGGETVAHSIPYCPAWTDDVCTENEFGSVPPRGNAPFPIPRAGTDHITRDNAGLDALHGLMVPIHGRHQDLDGPPNIPRIKIIRLLTGGTAATGHITVSGNTPFYPFIPLFDPDSTVRIHAHNLAYVGIHSRSSAIEDIDWESLRGSAIGIQVWYEMYVGERPGDIGEDSGYQPWPWIHSQPGGVSTANDCQEATGLIGWFGPLNSDMDTSTHTYRFQNLGPVGFMNAVATWTGECSWTASGTFTISGVDYAWNATLYTGFGTGNNSPLNRNPPFFEPLQNPILLTQSYLPCLHLAVGCIPTDGCDDVWYVPTDSVTPDEYENTRNSTWYYWQNHGGLFIGGGTTSFVPAWRRQTDTSSGFTPQSFTNLPPQINVIKEAL